MKFLIILFFATQSWAADFKKCSDFQIKGTFKNEDAKLDALMKLHWSYVMQTFPEWATFVGYPGKNDEWTDDSIVAINARKADLKCEIEALKLIKTKSLSTSAKLNHDLLMNRYSDNFMPIRLKYNVSFLMDFPGKLLCMFVRSKEFRTPKVSEMKLNDRSDG